MNSERRLLATALSTRARSTGRAHEDSAVQVPARIKATTPCSAYWASWCCLVMSLERHTGRSSWLWKRRVFIALLTAHSGVSVSRS